LKILFLSHKFSPDIGGIEATSEMMAEGFAAAGHDIHVMTWSEKNSEKHFPFEIIRKPDNKRLIREHRWADLVFENNPCLRMVWPALFTGRPSVIALQTWISRSDGKRNLQDRLKRAWLNRADSVIAISKAVRERCFPPATLIHNPYRENDFRINPGIEKTEDFIFLGRLVSDKGADIAIQAMELLIGQEMKNTTEGTRRSLTIVGDGPELSNLETMVKEKNLQDFIRFTGSMRGEELVKCLNRHRFLLVPSVWEEPFGIVALEGMACGCIPIVSDGGGLPDAVGKAGLIFHRGDVNDLFKRIQELLNNPGLMKELKNAAREHLKEHQANVITRKYLDIIEAIGNNKKNS
jgi:glycosyltransferase involved in cell wall biosynthesis